MCNLIDKKRNTFFFVCVSLLYCLCDRHRDLCAVNDASPAPGWVSGRENQSAALTASPAQMARSLTQQVMGTMTLFLIGYL